MGRYAHLSNLNDNQFKFGYYKDFISEFIPNIRLIQFSKANDKLIQKAFEKRIHTINSTILEQGIFIAEVCLFDKVFFAMEGDETESQHLKWLNGELSILVNLLDKLLLKKFEKTLVSLFIDFDNSKARYFSRAGEVGVLSRFLTNDEFTVIDIERKIKNGKSIDFVIKYVPNGRLFLVEVINLILKSEIQDSKWLRAFLEKRFFDKFADKVEGLDKIPFILAPVIWTEELHLLKQYKDAFGLIEEYEGAILPPLGLYRFIKGDECVCVFSSIPDVINTFGECIGKE